MTNPATTTFIVISQSSQQYYLLKIVRRGFDIYCIPPHLGLHYSLHESGEAHFQSEVKVDEENNGPPVVLQDGEAGIPIEHGIMRAPIGDLGRASGICTAIYPIDSLSADFRKFNRHPSECFVIDIDSLPEGTTLVEIGVWAVPKRNEVGFEQNIPNISPDLLHKVVQGDPQIWIYARPFA